MEKHRERILESLGKYGLGNPLVYRDYAGTWRDPATGELFKQDAIFAWQNI